MLQLAVETYDNGGGGVDKDSLIDPINENFVWWSVGSTKKHILLRVYLMHSNGCRVSIPDGESIRVTASLVFMNDEFVPNQYQNRSSGSGSSKGAPIFQILGEDSNLLVNKDQPALIRFRINEVSSSRILGGSKIFPKKFRVLVFVHGRPDIAPARSVCIDVKSKTNNVKNPKKSPRPNDDGVPSGTIDNKKQKVDMSLNLEGLNSGSGGNCDPTLFKQRMHDAIIDTIKSFQERTVNNMIQSSCDGNGLTPTAAASLVADIGDLQEELLTIMDREMALAMDERQSAHSARSVHSARSARSVYSEPLSTARSEGGVWEEEEEDDEDGYALPHSSRHNSYNNSFNSSYTTSYNRLAQSGESSSSSSMLAGLPVAMEVEGGGGALEKIEGEGVDEGEGQRRRPVNFQPIQPIRPSSSPSTITSYSTTSSTTSTKSTHNTSSSLQATLVLNSLNAEDTDTDTDSAVRNGAPGKGVGSATTAAPQPAANMPPPTFYPSVTIPSILFALPPGPAITAPAAYPTSHSSSHPANHPATYAPTHTHPFTHPASHPASHSATRRNTQSPTNPSSLLIQRDGCAFDSFEEAFHALDEIVFNEIVFTSLAQISRQGTNERVPADLSGDVTLDVAVAGTRSMVNTP